MNTNGAILEHVVTPGTLHNVIYLTREIVADVLREGVAASSVTKTIFVGDEASRHIAKNQRSITLGHQLSDQDVENLKLLKGLGATQEAFAAARGGITSAMRMSLYGEGRGEYELSVSAPSSESLQAPKFDAYSHSFRRNYDPTIELRVRTFDQKKSSDTSQSDDIVRNLMLMGGEIAARWCTERSIPVIYRVSQRNGNQQDPVEYYRREIQPLLQTKQPLPHLVLQKYMVLLGSIQLSTIASPHLPLGLPMFARYVYLRIASVLCNAAMFVTFMS
jgi:hypothetical protein